MNITQQVAASIGTALFSVLLTNGFNDVDATTPAGVLGEHGRRVRGGASWSATILVAACLIPAGLPAARARSPGTAVDPAAEC